MKQMKRLLAAVAVATLALWGCRGGQNTPEQPLSPATDYSQVAIPTFDADSAYSYVAAQVAFGFRHPGTKGHEQCADYLARMMRRWCDTVIVQPFTATLWNGEQAKGKNIIGSLAPEKEKRVLLAAHWDSRQWADQDLDTNNWRQPLLGANDGASGVGTLMEMARVMAAMPPDVGVDFIFFDIEDQGIPSWENRYEDNTWCKGSQHWAQNPHRLLYHAVYGILFDMVGTESPRFTKEEISMGFAPGLVNKMWNCAAFLGYGNVFVDELSGAILDDHLYVNQILRIPTIDIVQNDPHVSFFPHWHTVNDNLDAVKPQSLKTVATVTMKVIYGDYPSKTKE